MTTRISKNTLGGFKSPARLSAIPSAPNIGAATRAVREPLAPKTDYPKSAPVPGASLSTATVPSMTPGMITPSVTPAAGPKPSVPRTPAMTADKRAARENEYRNVSSARLSNPAPVSSDVASVQRELNQMEAQAQQYEKMGDYATAKAIRANAEEARRGVVNQIRQGASAVRPPAPSAAVGPQHSEMLNSLRSADRARASTAGQIEDIYSNAGLRPSQAQAARFLEQKYGRPISPEEAQIIRTANDENLYRMLMSEGAFK